MRLWLLPVLAFFALFSVPNSEDQVGPVGTAHRVTTGLLVEPAGQTHEYNGRPVDLALSADGSLLFVKDMAGLLILDPDTLQEVQPIVASPGGASAFGLAVTSDSVWFSTAGNGVHLYRQGEDGQWKVERTVTLAGPNGQGASYPTGLLVREESLWVALSRNNTLAEVDLETGTVKREIEVGIAPYDIENLGGGLLAVSCQGGPRAKEGQETAPSAGTETPVDARGVTIGGSVSIVDVREGKQVNEIRVGKQPTQMMQVMGFLAVANANSDSVTVIDPTSGEVFLTTDVKPNPDLPFGSMPNAMIQAGGRVYVANAGNNAIVVADGGSGAPLGLIPTGWYPCALAANQTHLFIANNKGIGSRTRERAEAVGWNSHDHRGSIQKVAFPDQAALQAMTAKATELAQTPQILRAMELTGSTEAAPKAIPARLGDPSPIQHVIYVIKENRTYDQCFGDLPQGDGDPTLATFGRPVIPNHYALAEEFVLLDNYYCMGVLSADGHSYATEGNLTPYLNRAFGGFNRSYTFGDDPLTYSSSGFVWDAFLEAGLSFRNYGEFDYAEPPTGMDYKAIYAAYQRGERIEFTQKIGIANVRRYSDRDYPGWNMVIPDVLRMDRFLEEFREMEASGVMPNLIVLYLPQDHGGGGVSMTSHMADNDQAIGRLVDAVSNSQFWPKTAIFINEDDPQAGYDHVDGHRSICLVASPYAKRGEVVSHFYNQASVLRTMLHIFGLPPLNQTMAAAPLMTECFVDEPNLEPYTNIPTELPLDAEFPAGSPLAALWGTLERGGPDRMDAEEMDRFNRAIWMEFKGEAPYPVALAGAHGRGLAERGLKLGEGVEEDD